jgi:hypothetical protein
MTVRLPVIYQGKPLMPMKASRVKRFVAEGKGKICFDRKLMIHYLKLCVLPSGVAMQEMTVGIDPGSTFDGVSVVSKTTHHANIELIQRQKKGKTSIKFFKTRQAMNRRIRRSRLRHRPIRFDNRTSKKLAPTIKANLDFRKWLVTKLMALYPLSRVVVEDVRFNHAKYRAGRSFSHVEQGKNELYQFLTDVGLKLDLYQGYNTKKLRVNSFGQDKKAKAKDAKTFEAHCLDSYVLACDKIINEEIDSETGEITEQPRIVCHPARKINKRVVFIEKIVKIKRCLFRTRALYRIDKNPLGGAYYRYARHGIKVPFECRSNKDNKMRVKPEGEHSNHPKKWIYLDNGRALRGKCNTARYGGTTYKKNKNIDSKTNETTNRKIEVISISKDTKKRK